MPGATIEEFNAAEREELKLRDAHLREQELRLSNAEENVEYCLVSEESKGSTGADEHAQDLDTEAAVKYYLLSEEAEGSTELYESTREWL